MDHTDPAFHGTVVALVIIIVVCAIARKSRHFLLRDSGCQAGGAEKYFLVARLNNGGAAFKS